MRLPRNAITILQKEKNGKDFCYRDSDMHAFYNTKSGQRRLAERKTQVRWIREYTLMHPATGANRTAAEIFVSASSPQ